MNQVVTRQHLQFTLAVVNWQSKKLLFHKNYVEKRDFHAGFGQLILTVASQLLGRFIVIQRRRRDTATLPLKVP